MTALLVDTNSLFFRAHYALPPMSTARGEHTSAIYGVAALLLKLLRELRPTGLAFARDLPTPTFRHEVYGAYKSGRPPMPSALQTQWGRLDQLIAAFDVPSYGVRGFEADDVLATLARRIPDDVVIASGDRDLFQTVGPRVRVLFLGARGKQPESIDAALVRARYGVEPGQLPLYAALVGEASDNLIGVAGVGARTATRLVQQFGTAQRLVSQLDSVQPAKIRAALEAAKERIVQNEMLATLRADLPLEGDLVRAPRYERVRTLFEELEFKSLLARLPAE